MKKKTKLFIICLSFSFICLAQPSVKWTKCFGGGLEDEMESIQKTPDGGFIALGFSNSDDFPNSGWHEGYRKGVHPTNDYLILKFNSKGDIEWKQWYGGSGEEYGVSVNTTDDNGYIMAGTSRSSKNIVTGWHESYDEFDSPTLDIWVVKTDNTGNILWQNCYGGNRNDFPNYVFQTKDSGYLIIGYTFSNDGDVSGYHEGYTEAGYLQPDYWILKLDSQGKIVWQKTLGGSGRDEASFAIQANDEGYLIVGFSGSSDGDIDTEIVSGDFWLVKLNHQGKIEWQRSIGGNQTDFPKAIKETVDKGYIILGNTWSDSVYGIENHGKSDILAIKIDSTGNVIWHNLYGGTKDDYAIMVLPTNDKGFVISSTSKSMDGDIGYCGNENWFSNNWIFKIDSLGTMQWQTCIEVLGEDVSIAKNNDGEYIIGATKSCYSGFDMWFAKLGFKETQKK